MNTYVYSCINTYILIYMYRYEFVYMYVYLCIFIYIRTYTHIYIYKCLYVYIYTCVNIQCKNVYIFVLFEVYIYSNYIYVFSYVQLCLLIYTLLHILNFVCPFLVFPLSYPPSLVSCTGILKYLAIRSAACRACLIASPLLIPMLCGMGTTRRRDAATTAHSTPSTCRATACVCSAPMAHTRTELVL